MQARSPIETLLLELLDRELTRRGGLATGPAADAAREELRRALGTGWNGGPRSLSSTQLEALIARSLAVGEGAPVPPLPTAPQDPSGLASPTYWNGVRDSLAHLASVDGDAVGEVFDDKYELEELLAEGGFGKVYRARDRDLDCSVAIKVLKPVAGEGEAQLAAFKGEARRLTRLKHPNIVEWKTLNQTEEGVLYLVMEFLEGEVLEDALRREERLTPERSARILLGVLDALRHAHRLADGTSLLHLDLKPSNVFLVQDAHGEERVKVLDFGISRFAGREPRTTFQAHSALAAGALEIGETTRFGKASDPESISACTPLYCPPELAARILGPEPEAERAPQPLDGRSDLYSLGVMAFRMLAGRPPLEGGGGTVDLLRQHRDAAAPPVGSCGVRVPRRLARFVDRCLRKDPDERFRDAQEAYEELRRIVEPRRSALVLTAVAVGLTSAVLLWTQSSADDGFPRLEAVSRTTNRSLGNSTLHFGPAQDTHAIDLVDLEAGVTDLRLAREPRADAETLSGWTLERSGARGVALAASESVPSGATRAFLEVGTQAGPRWSAPLTLRYLRPDEWEIVSADAPERAGRLLAPRGQSLELVVRGERALLAPGAEVTFGPETYGAPRDEQRSSAERSVYRLALDLVDLPTGVHTAEVSIADVAGNRHETAVELTVVEEPLRLDEARLEGATFAAGRWYVLEGETITLAVESSREAVLRWRVEDANGRRLAASSPSDAATSHRVPLRAEEWASGSFGGSLHLELDENHRVAHAPGSSAGVAERRLAFEVRTVGAEFDVVLNGVRRHLQPEWQEEVHYTREGRLPLDVLRDHDVPMAVAVRCARDADDAPPEAPEPLVFATVQELRHDLELALAEDGLYRLALESRRLDADGHPIETLDSERTVLVVRDTEAPRVELEAWDDEDRLVRSEAELRALPFAVSVVDAAWTPSPAPVELTWDLEVERANRSTQRSSGVVPTSVGQTLEFTLPEDALPEPNELDGTYRLTLGARDFSGNRASVGTRATWTVSSAGPELRVLAPTAGEVWARLERGFTVEVRAEDANDVRSVSCVLSDPEDRLRPIALDLERTERATHWRGRFEPNYAWSGRRALLRVDARDGAGTAASAPTELACSLAEIPSAVPEHARIAYRNRGATRMRRVAGNHDTEYFFGGRGDQVENATFRTGGLAEFSASPIESSLRVLVPRGTIDDFYLDEFEVNCGQFLAFVRAPEAAEAFPDAERRAALELELAAGDTNLPATGMTYGEALAFARWSGKELPTYLHWEYAVRGAEARPYSFFGVEPVSEVGRSVNVDGPGPWPVSAGNDRTPDWGITNLCSNVAEWTGTPAVGLLSQVSMEELLLPGESLPGDRHYTVGGNFARRPFHFGIVGRLSRARASASVGFRCMLPAARVESAYLTDGSQLSVEPLP